MRYLWLIFLTIFIGLGAIFVYQNQAQVSVHFRLDWINLSFGLSVIPLFVPILLALVCGILVTTLYLFTYHAYLRIRIRTQNSEIFRLKKLVLLERDKREQVTLENQKLRQVAPSKNTGKRDNSSDSKNETLAPLDQETVLTSPEDGASEDPSSKSS